MPAQDPYLFLRKCIKTIHAEDAGIAFFASEYAGLLLFLRAVGLFGNRNFGGETPFFVRKILPTAAMHGNGNRRATHLLGPYTASFFSRLNLAAAPGHEIRNPADVLEYMYENFDFVRDGKARPFAAQRSRPPHSGRTAALTTTYDCFSEGAAPRGARDILSLRAHNYLRQLATAYGDLPLLATACGCFWEGAQAQRGARDVQGLLRHGLRAGNLPQARQV